MDDFAHHPTAVHETLLGLKLFHPERRLIAAFEPRTNSSRRNVFQETLFACVFRGGYHLHQTARRRMDAIPATERLDTPRLVDDIRKARVRMRAFFQTHGRIA